MATKEEIRLVIKSELDSALKDLKKFNKELDNSDAGTKSSEKSFLKWGAAIGVTALAINELGAFLGDAVKASSDLEEQTNKFNVVFKDVQSEAAGFRDTLVNAYGLSRAEATKLLASTGDLLTGFGFTGKAALDLSAQVQALAIDLASFQNLEGGATQASEALTKGLLGERESLKTLGIVIRETDVQQALFAKGQDKLTGQALLAARAQATFELAVAQSKNAIGDAINTQDSFANVSRRVASRLMDMKAVAGDNLTPALARLGKAFLTSSGEGGIFHSALNGITMVAGKAIDILANLIDILNKAFDEKHQAQIKTGELRYKGQTGAIEANIKALKQRRDALEENNSESKELAGIEEAIKKNEAELEAASGNLSEAIKERRKLVGDVNEVVKKGIDIQNQSTTAISEAARISKEEAKKEAEEKQKALQTYYDFVNTEEQKKIAKANEAFALAVEAHILNAEQLEILEFEHQERLNQIREEARQKEIQQQTAAFNTFLTNTQNIVSQVTAIFAQYYKNQQIQQQQTLDKNLAAINKYYDDLVAAAVANGADTTAIEEERQAALTAAREKADRERRKLERAQAVREKQLAIIAATINTAQAITRALTAGPIAGPILAGIIAALGATQIGLIASQPLPKAQEGAIIPGSAEGTPLIAGENNRTEAIIPLENDAPGVGGNTINIYVENLNGNSDLPPAFVEAIDRGLTRLSQDGNSTFRETVRI